MDKEAWRAAVHEDAESDMTDHWSELNWNEILEKIDSLSKSMAFKQDANFHTQMIHKKKYCFLKINF